MTKRYTLITFLFVSLSCAATSAGAQATIPSNSLLSAVNDSYLDRLISAAKVNYPRVKQFVHRVNASKANYDKTKLSWLEYFTFSYVYQPYNLNIINQPVNATSPAYTYFNGLQAGVFLNLGSLIERPAVIRQAKEELASVGNEQQEYLSLLELDVKTRYYTYLRSVQSLKNLNQSVNDADALTQDMRHRYQKNEETFENLTRAQTTLTQQQELKTQAEANYLIAKASLEQLIGDKLENIK